MCGVSVSTAAGVTAVKLYLAHPNEENLLEHTEGNRGSSLGRCHSPTM